MGRIHQILENEMGSDYETTKAFKRILSGYASYTHVPKGLETAADFSMDEAMEIIDSLVQQERLKAQIEMLEATDGMYLRVMLDGDEDGNYPSAEKYLERLKEQLKEHEDSDARN